MPHAVLSLLHAYAGSILAIQWGSYSFIWPMKGLWHREFSNLPKVTQPVSVQAGIESRRSGSTVCCCLTTLWVQKTLGNISALLLTSPLGGYLGVGQGHFRKPLFPSSFFLPWWSGGPLPGPIPPPSTLRLLWLVGGMVQVGGGAQGLVLGLGRGGVGFYRAWSLCYLGSLL